MLVNFLIITPWNGEICGNGQADRELIGGCVNAQQIAIIPESGAPTPYTHWWDGVQLVAYTLEQKLNKHSRVPSIFNRWSNELMDWAS